MTVLLMLGGLGSVGSMAAGRQKCTRYEQAATDTDKNSLSSVRPTQTVHTTFIFFFQAEARHKEGEHGAGGRGFEFHDGALFDSARMQVEDATLPPPSKGGRSISNAQAHFMALRLRDVISLDFCMTISLCRFFSESRRRCSSTCTSIATDCI